MTLYQGAQSAPQKRVAIIASRYNDFVVQVLIDGADAHFQHLGVPAKNIDVIRVPGAWELPVAAKKALDSQIYGGLIILGCVLRGDTAHFEHVAGEAARALATLSMQSGVPVTNGLLACDNLDQALDRAGGKHGNKGQEAASALIEMMTLFEQWP